MADPWKGYAAVNDDVRHTYERVFYGRQLTDNAMENDVAGMARQPGLREPEAGAGTVWGPGEGTTASPAQSLYGTDPSHAEREAGAFAWQHAENAPGIRREMETADGGRPYTHTDAPDLVARGEDSRSALYGGPQPGGAEPGGTSRAADLYGPSSDAQGPGSGDVWGPAEGAAPGPTVEPPSAAPAAPANDMTPG